MIKEARGVYSMSKAKKRKSRIKLNETLNRQLDEMEDNSALEVFEPKGSSQLEFFNLVNEAMEQEDLQNNTSKKKNRAGRKNNETIGAGGIFLILVLCLLFVGFLFVLSNIIL